MHFQGRKCRAPEDDKPSLPVGSGNFHRVEKKVEKQIKKRKTKGEEIKDKLTVILRIGAILEKRMGRI